MRFAQIFSIFHSWFLGNTPDLDFPGSDNGDRYRTPGSSGSDKHFWVCFILSLWNWIEGFIKHNFPMFGFRKPKHGGWG